MRVVRASSITATKDYTPTKFSYMTKLVEIHRLVSKGNKKYKNY